MNNQPLLKKGNTVCIRWGVSCNIISALRLRCESFFLFPLSIVLNIFSCNIRLHHSQFPALSESLSRIYIAASLLDHSLSIIALNKRSFMLYQLGFVQCVSGVESPKSTSEDTITLEFEKISLLSSWGVTPNPWFTCLNQHYDRVMSAERRSVGFAFDVICACVEVYSSSLSPATLKR